MPIAKQNTMKTKKELANNPTNIVLLAKCLCQKER